MPDVNSLAGRIDGDLDWNDQKYYFLAEETRREFAERNKIAIG